MSSAVSNLTDRHLEKVRAFYEQSPAQPKWAARFYRRLLAHYFNLLIPADASVLEVGCGSGDLLAQLRATKKTGIDLSPAQIAAAQQRMPDAKFWVQSGEQLALEEKFDVIIVSDALNLAGDVQRLLERLQTVAHPDTRLLINFQNSLWRPMLSLAVALGLKARQPENSWLASSDVLNLLQLAGWQSISRQGRILAPVPLLGLESFFNRWLAPLFPWFCLTIFIAARPQRRAFARAVRRRTSAG